MKRTQRNETGDQALWRRYRDATRQAGPNDIEFRGDDALRIAAYLDGTLSKRDRRAFEGRLAASPGLLNALLAARASRGLAEAAPDAVVVWAKNLAASENRRDGNANNTGRAGSARGGGRTGLRAGVLAAWSTAALLCAVVAGTVAYYIPVSDDTARLASRAPKPPVAASSLAKRDQAKKAKRATKSSGIKTSNGADLDDLENSFFFKWDAD